MGSRDATHRFKLNVTEEQLDNSFWLYSIGEVMRYISPRYISHNLSVLVEDDKKVLSITLGKINTFIHELHSI